MVQFELKQHYQLVISFNIPYMISSGMNGYEPLIGLYVYNTLSGGILSVLHATL